MSQRRCFNCKARDVAWRPLCDDCWRMGLIVGGLGSTLGGEVVHRIIALIFGAAL